MKEYIKEQTQKEELLSAGHKTAPSMMPCIEHVFIHCSGDFQHQHSLINC